MQAEVGSPHGRVVSPALRSIAWPTRREASPSQTVGSAVSMAVASRARAGPPSATAFRRTTVTASAASGHGFFPVATLPASLQRTSSPPRYALQGSVVPRSREGSPQPLPHPTFAFSASSSSATRERSPQPCFGAHVRACSPPVGVPIMQLPRRDVSEGQASSLPTEACVSSGRSSGTRSAPAVSFVSLQRAGPGRYIQSVPLPGMQVNFAPIASSACAGSAQRTGSATARQSCHVASVVGVQGTTPSSPPRAARGTVSGPAGPAITAWPSSAPSMLPQVQHASLPPMGLPVSSAQGRARANSPPQRLPSQRLPLNGTGAGGEHRRRGADH